MSFSGEDLSEFFDVDDFADCYAVSYTQHDNTVVNTTLFLTERSGMLEDGTVRSSFYEVEINRQEVQTPQTGDTFTVNGNTYRITAISSMDNDIAACEAEKT